MICFSYQVVVAQSWLSGYNFRKKITIEKSRIKGNTNLTDFPFLISIVDSDLVNLQSCDQKITDPGGLDISFSLASQPTIPIAFQLDSYEPSIGKLTCWVRLEQLIAGSNTGNNSLYLYYGSNVTSDPFELHSTSVWTIDYDRLWHMNADPPGKNLRTANGLALKAALASASIQHENFVSGKIGSAVQFNGLSDAFYASADTNTTFCITAWIKPKAIGKEQVILTNDSLGGYRLSLDEAGKLVFDIIAGNRKITSTSTNALDPDTWYYIGASFSNVQRRLFINGIQVGGGIGTIVPTTGGRLKIGCSKIQDKWFEGQIDELRIQSVVRSIDWMGTEYLNQHEPGLAYAISQEEKNPVQTSIAYEFTDEEGTQLWLDAGNWKHHKVPPQSANIIVQPNKVLRVNGSVQLNKLSLESAASLYSEGELSINCLATIASGAKIRLSSQSQVRFNADVINNGAIIGAGSIVLAGTQKLQTLSGAGVITIPILTLNLPNKEHLVLLQTAVQIEKYLKLERGTLNANGKLSLLADAEGTASIGPIRDVANTTLIGVVNVQQFIEGSFPLPATARGWRLLASPVYHNNQYQYQIKDIQERVFVTGPMGVAHGFDPSANNSSTIYTHNQALPGTLSQKYTGIADVNVQVAFGRGIYLFSRGDRSMPSAFAQQIQGPVFVNPEAYVLNYKGFLFIGDLKLNLENRNAGDPGDGFNLLGNPYAAAIVWSRLLKVNTGPFVWTFNPKNNAYQVTDDPNFIIPAGTGFFVRVNTGYTNGSLTFTEQSKYLASTEFSHAGKIQSAEKQQDLFVPKRLNVKISKDELSDDYTVIFSPNGNRGATDADAAKIGSGYLSISGLTADQQRLAIEDRPELIDADTVHLSIKVWAEGPCRLSFKGLAELNASTILVDHKLNIRREITSVNNTYDFNLDAKDVKGGDIKRFSILLQRVKPTLIIKENQDLSIYPNPFKDYFYIKSQDREIKVLKVTIRNIIGEIVFSSPTATLLPGQQIEIRPIPLGEGIYMMSLFDLDNKKTTTTKLIKTTP